MINFSFTDILNQGAGIARQAKVALKYKLSDDQLKILARFIVDIFYNKKNLEDLPKKLPQILNLTPEVSDDFIKELVTERFLVANDLFNGWPKKFLLGAGATEQEIDEKIIKQVKELDEELKTENPVEAETEEESNVEIQPYQSLEVKDARLAAVSAVRDNLKELCSPTLDFESLALFHNILFDYILGQGQDDVKNITEIVKVLDENKLVIGNSNLSVAGESVQPTVANWLALFRSKIGAGNWTDTLAIPKFLAGHEAGLLPPAEKIFLGRVLEFYRRLKGYPETLASLQEPDLGFIPALLESRISNLEFRIATPDVQIKSGTKPVIPSGAEGSLHFSRDDKPVSPSPTPQTIPNSKFQIPNSTSRSISDIKPKPIQNSEFRIQNSQTNLLNEDEEAELSSHKLGTANPYNLKPKTSEADLEKLVNEASAKSGVKFRDEAMQKRFTTAAVMFLKGIRDEMEIREMILKDENLGGLGAPEAILNPVLKMLGNLKSQLTTTNSQLPTSEAVVPKNFDPKNSLKQMLDAEATASATILPKPEKKVVSSEYLVLRKPQNNTSPNAAPIKPIQNESLPTNYSQLPTPSAKPPEPVLSAVEGARNDKVVQAPPSLTPSTIPNSKFQIPNSTPHSMSDVTKPHPLMGGVEEMQYLSLADFRSLGATTEQRVARLNEKFALIKKESLAKFVSAIKAYRASPLFQQYVTLGANSLGQSKTITQEIAGDTGAGNFLTVEEFDALADFHGSLVY